MSPVRAVSAGAGHNADAVLGERSRYEFERAKRITPGGSMRAAPFFSPHPPYAASGVGPWVTDADGRHVFDCANNFFSLIHGHSFPPILAELQRALADGTAFGLPTISETALAEEIRSRSPRLEQIRFTGSGTEAVMFAVKAARAITGRSAIAKFEGAYHGGYDYVEVSLDPGPDTWGERIPNSVTYARGAPASVADEVVVLPYDDAELCKEILSTHGHRLAAVLVDPLASRVGMVAMSDAVRDAVTTCCRKHGILLVLDEVVSYRMAFGGAHEALGYEPDLVALAKIIGGGLPVGAVAGPARHMSVFDHTGGKAAVSHGGTFSANPLSMRAGLVALQAYDAGAVERLNGLGAALRDNLDRNIRSMGLPAQVTGASSFMRLHLKTGPITGYRSCYPSASARVALKAVHLAVLERGFLLTPTCSAALSTPMTAGDLEDLTKAITEALQDVWQTTRWE
jgi:glutamate-1-semialdehyde 2,1-aminomutase